MFTPKAIYSHRYKLPSLKEKLKYQSKKLSFIANNNLDNENSFYSNQRQEKYHQSADFDLEQQLLSNKESQRAYQNPVQILANINYRLNQTLEILNIRESLINQAKIISDKTVDKKPIKKYTRKLKELRNMNLLATTKKGFQTKPKLKQTKSVCKGTISILVNTKKFRDQVSKQQVNFVKANKYDKSKKNQDKMKKYMIN